jgi:UPF0755 protein
LIGLLAALIIFTFIANTIHSKFLLNDYLSTTTTSQVEIVIEDGDTGTQIAQKLKKAGVIKASKVFYKVAINDKRSNSISPGIHEIDIKISARSALDQLLDPKRNRALFGFIEGLRTAEVIDLLEKSNLVSGRLSSDVKPDSIYKTSNLPAQYAFLPGTQIDDAVNQMVQRFNIAAKESKIEEGFKGFLPLELVTIASIIQAEGDEQDFTKIAQVIYNRLKIGMPLQMNATIDYAANLRGNIRLPYKRLEINSRYNTYKFRGLPPGPIGNPGQSALNAATNPLPGEWLYFVTVKPNDTRFTNSFDQFNIWANEFRKNEKAGLFE